jgi:hypothetical protein
MILLPSENCSPRSGKLTTTVTMSGVHSIIKNLRRLWERAGQKMRDSEVLSENQAAFFF